MGAIICPPSPGFYTKPTTIEELIDHTVSRLLDVVGAPLSVPLAPRWQGPGERRSGGRAANGETADPE